MQIGYKYCACRIENIVRDSTIRDIITVTVLEVTFQHFLVPGNPYFTS